jgi:NADPH:quinone reductase-like Zn-dependent oxidoreductase
MVTTVSPPPEGSPARHVDARQAERSNDMGRMRAIVQDRYGPPDVLQLREVDTPAIGDSDVLLRVQAAGIHQGDWHFMTGIPYVMRLGTGMRKPKSRVRGTDVAARVEAVGSSVTRFRPGDDVFGTCSGAFAELACANEETLVFKPTNLTYVQAAAIPTSGVTALQGLRDAGKVQAGQRVLIIGAAGGVGTFAVQLAKAFGAEVTGVCSTTKVELVRSIGADEVIDYTQHDFADGVHRYDLILDTAGNRSVTHLRRALAQRGTLVIVGGEGGGRWFGLGRQFRALMTSPFVSHALRTFIAKPRKQDLELLKELAESGKVSPVIDSTCQLAEVAAAIRYLAEGHARGKVVVTVAALHEGD